MCYPHPISVMVGVGARCSSRSVMSSSGGSIDRVCVEKKRRRVLIASEWGGARGGPGECDIAQRWNWCGAPAAGGRVCQPTWAVVPRFE
jgi:hypothetical protein